MDTKNIGAKTIYLDNKDDIHHMMKVLRLNEGDEIDISDGDQWEYKAVIKKLDSCQCEAEITDKQKFTREPEVKITLFQGIPKQGKMETIVQKSVELGVWKIVPVFMDRTVVVDKGNFNKKIQRWQKISSEAVKQCRRGIIPEVCEAVMSENITDNFSGFDLVLFPYENEERQTVKDVLRAYAEKDVKSVAVIIGPEGGFSDDEAVRIVKAGGKSVSLGKTVLRTETAGIAAVSMIMYELEL